MSFLKRFTPTTNYKAANDNSPSKDNSGLFDSSTNNIYKDSERKNKNINLGMNNKQKYLVR